MSDGTVPDTHDDVPYTEGNTTDLPPDVESALSRELAVSESPTVVRAVSGSDTYSERALVGDTLPDRVETVSSFSPTDGF